MTREWTVLCVFPIWELKIRALFSNGWFEAMDRHLMTNFESKFSLTLVLRRGGGCTNPLLTKFFLPYKNALTYRQTTSHTFKLILCAYFRKKILTVPPSRWVRCPFKVGMLGGGGLVRLHDIYNALFRYFLNRYPFET